MTTIIQSFLLKNTKGLQNLVNNKLAVSGPFKKFWKWMEIGTRGYGKHVLPNYFRLFNSFMLTLGQRFNWHRPHVGKYLLSKEREIFLTGYSFVLIFFFVVCKKNAISPLFTANDPFLNNYDNPNKFSEQFGKFIPNFVNSYKVSAHYLEINKIFGREMLKHYQKAEAKVASEFYECSERERRTKYLSNPYYVYEPFGWEK